jgi:hypothetical protein
MTESEKFMRKLRKVRRQMYEETKDLSDEEWVKYYNDGAQKTLDELGISRHPNSPEQV